MNNDVPYDFCTEGIYYKINNDGKTVSVTHKNIYQPGHIGFKQYGGYDLDNLNIPTYVIGNGEEYIVTSIGKGAFFNCTKITTITIPDSVTNIGKDAFFGCASIKSIEIPNSLTSIGGGAFLGCSGLTSITIPDSVTSIGEFAFLDCIGLTTITIPKGIESIVRGMCFECKNMTSITIPENVKSIEESAFENCENLTTIIIPKSVKNIGDKAFRGCVNLTSITIPDSVTRIGEAAFKDCKKLKSLNIPESVTCIGINAFEGCEILNNIKIPKSVICIYEQTPYGPIVHSTENCLPLLKNNIYSDVFSKPKTKTIKLGSHNIFKFTGRQITSKLVISKNKNSKGENTTLIFVNKNKRFYFVPLSDIYLDANNRELIMPKKHPVPVLNQIYRDIIPSRKYKGCYVLAPDSDIEPIFKEFENPEGIKFWVMAYEEITLYQYIWRKDLFKARGMISIDKDKYYDEYLSKHQLNVKLREDEKLKHKINEEISREAEEATEALFEEAGYDFIHW